MPSIKNPGDTPPSDLIYQCHANNAYAVLRIDGAIAVAAGGKIVALTSTGVETVLFENKTDREQQVVSPTGKIIVKAA